MLKENVEICNILNRFKIRFREVQITLRSNDLRVGRLFVINIMVGVPNEV